MTQAKHLPSQLKQVAKRPRSEDGTPTSLKRQKVEHSPSAGILSVPLAATKLQQGEVVAFPTETVFGLGADATNDAAVAKIFRAKGRPSDNPLIVHVASIDQITFVEEISDTAQKLAQKFWPGPLSIVFKHRSGICDKVRAGLDTVAVRIPAHPVALELLKAANVPVSAPSANISGKPSPTCTQHVLDDLANRGISGVVDGACCEVGVESTVVKLTGNKVTILRPGKVTKQMLETVVGTGNVHLDAHLKTEDETPLAPGMKYRHYAPEVPLLCVEGSDEFFRDTVLEGLKTHKLVGVMYTSENEHKKEFERDDRILALNLGSRNDVAALCQNLFSCLRSLDQSKVTQIFSETVPAEGLGFAFMNRLLKAASNQIVTE